MLAERKATDPSAAWFAWRGALAKRGDPAGDDPLANYEFGLKVGQRIALERTATWAGLVPLLQDVLTYLTELAIERDAEQLDDEPVPF